MNRIRMRRGALIRSLSLFLCVLMCLLLLPPLRAAAGAEDAPYRIYHWTGNRGENDQMEFYRVYPEGEFVGVPTFYIRAEDVYTNSSSGGDVRISFYRYYDSATEEQAVAFCQYLLGQSKAEQRYAGWYWFQEADYNFPSYYVYLVEGWDFSNPSLDLEKLINRNPWLNESGVKLTLHFIDYGNVISQEWSWLSDELGCCSALYIDRSGRRGITLGLAFSDAETGRVLRRYCPNES